MTLTAEDYCFIFRMDIPKYNFNRKEFILKFGSDFLMSCQNNPNKNPITGYLKYKAFQTEVSKAQKVFNEISDIIVKAGKKPLSKGLFSVFYASYVITARKALFKEVQDKIDHKKKIAEAQWAQLAGLSDKLKSNEYETKKKVKGSGN